MLRAEALEAMLWMCHVEPARVSLRYAGPSPRQLPDSMHRLAKNSSIESPVSYLDTVMKTGSEIIESIVRRKQILFAGFVARMQDTRRSKRVMFGELMEGAG